MGGDGNAQGNKEVASDWCESTAAVKKKERKDTAGRKIQRGCAQIFILLKRH